MEERIALGSGKIYVKERPETLSTDLENIDTLITKYCVAANEFGAVKNGATLTYTPTNYTAKLNRYRRKLSFICFI